MSGDVGSQFTPCAGWAQSIRYHTDVLRDASWKGAIGVVLGGEGSVATNGFWSALTMATTLSLPMLFYVEDNGLGLSVRGEMQTPGANIARNLASFGNLFIRDGDGTDPAESAKLLAECVAHVRGGGGPALVRLTVPRLSSHSGPDNQRGYRTDAEIAADVARDPMPRLRAHLVPSLLSESEWNDLEAEVARDVQQALDAARARPYPDPANVARWVYADDSPGSPEAFGGLSRAERATLDGSETADDERRRGPFCRVGATNPAARARGQPEVSRVRRGRRTQRRRSSRHRRAPEAVRRTARLRHESFGRRNHRTRRRHGDQRIDAGRGDSIPEVRRPGRRTVEQLRHAAVAHGEPVRRADRGADARRIRERRRRPVAQPERRGALRARVRLARGDALECRRRGRAAPRGDARRGSDDLLRAPLAADDERRQRALSGRRLRAAVRSRRRANDRERPDARDVGRAGPSMCRSRRSDSATGSK